MAYIVNHRFLLLFTVRYSEAQIEPQWTTACRPLRGTDKPMPSKKKIEQNLVNQKLKIPRTAEQYFKLSEADQENWNRVAHVISKMRSADISLTQAAREFGVSPRMVLDLGGSALRTMGNGRYAANPKDNLLRVLVITTSQGLQETAVRGSNVASVIGSHSDAVQKYLRTGDASALKSFSHLTIRDASGNPIELLTDTDELDRLGSAGVLSFESLYARSS